MPYKRFKESIKGDAAKVGLDAPAKQYLVRRSKKLPVWMWIPIAQSLGIKMNPNDRAIVATILYSLTVLSAFVFVASTVTTVVSTAIESRTPVYKIINANSTESDITEGVVVVTFTVSWCALGLYAKNLAYRLYSSARFLDMVRLHAKTILKVNAAFVFFLLITTFVTVNNVQAYHNLYDKPATCSQVDVLCVLYRMRFVSQCVFSAFAILWNSLVGIVLLSVCRTNTMGIRRFIQDLEKEALIYENLRFGPGAPADDLMWLADNDADQSSEGESEPQINGKKRYSTVSTVTVFAEAASVAGVQLRNEAMCRESYADQVPSRNTLELLSVTTASASAAPASHGQMGSTSSSSAQDHNQASPMSTAVILQRYWRLSCATRISSLTFQRWTTCVTSLCLSWVSMGLVQWLSSTPQSMQVVQIGIPLLILPLLSAAYAEVNVEGKRLLKCICPMEQRLTAMYVMWQSPPQMTVFGLAINYAAMGTAGVGLIIALASRVVLKQLGAGNN